MRSEAPRRGHRHRRGGPRAGGRERRREATQGGGRGVSPGGLADRLPERGARWRLPHLGHRDREPRSTVPAVPCGRSCPRSRRMRGPNRASGGPSDRASGCRASGREPTAAKGAARAALSPGSSRGPPSGGDYGFDPGSKDQVVADSIGASIRALRRAASTWSGAALTFRKSATGRRPGTHAAVRDNGGDGRPGGAAGPTSRFP